MPTITVPGFSFSSRLIMVVEEVVRVEEVRLLGKVGLFAKVVLVLLAFKASAVKKGSRVLLSRRVLVVLSRCVPPSLSTIEAGAVKVGAQVCGRT
jgi:hypothetical protein